MRKALRKEDPASLAAAVGAGSQRGGWNRRGDRLGT